MENRSQWGSNIGFILAAAGSAVGLGNIWKFPGKAYAGGGGSFLLVYILIVILIGATVMLTEFTVGRHTHKNCVGAFKQINKKWTFIGGMGILTGFIILCYYSHVGGWVVKYMWAYLTEPSAVYADPKGYFLNFLGASGFPVQAAIIFPIIFMALTAAIIVKGVEAGIEKVNKVLMPSLFVILIVITIRAVTLPGAQEGLQYMLHFDPSLINSKVIMSALGQAFFSLSLGMGVMCTYASYLGKGENLIKNTFTVCTLDTLVALLAGFAIIPAVFAAGVEPGMGGGFAFISLATVFQSMPAGSIFGFLFYTLLFFAALTSAISILEGTVAYVCEERKLDRKKVTIVLAIIMYVFGILYTVSQVAVPLKGIWFDANGIAFPGLGDWMEFMTDKLLMPLGSLLFCIFVGWIWGVDNAAAEVEQDGSHKFALKGVWSILVKYVAPLAIIAIMLGEFGILKI